MLGVVVILFLFESSGGYGEVLDNAKYDQVYQPDTLEDLFAGLIEKRTGSCATPSVEIGRSVEQLNSDYVKWHNYYRCLHGVGPLTYDAELQETAKANVEMNVRTNGVAFTRSNTYGENLWMTAMAGDDFGVKDITGQDPVQSWYNEMSYFGYNFDAPNMFSYDTAQFTQLMWADTSRIGCWTAEHQFEEGMTRVFVACEYDPPGNVPSNTCITDWKQQVPPQA